MAGNGLYYATYKNADDWGMVIVLPCFTHPKSSVQGAQKLLLSRPCLVPESVGTTSVIKGPGGWLVIGNYTKIHRL